MGTKGEMSEGKEEKERRADSPPSSGRTPSHLKSVARVPKCFTLRRGLKRHPFVMPTVLSIELMDLQRSMCKPALSNEWETAPPTASVSQKKQLVLNNLF